MNLSEEHTKYLANKHRGGLNNLKGNTFEVIYATKEIIRLFSCSVNLENIYLSAQLDDTFVDDFQIIYENGQKVYHQCKNVQELSWGNGQKGSLLYDFKWQKTYSTANGESFRLKIVYSNSDCDLHICSIPDEITEVTDKELFSAYPTLNAILVASENFRNDIKAVLFGGMNGHTFDKLSAFAEIIRSEWLETATPNNWVSLASIKELSLHKYPRVINYKDLPNVELSNELKSIFERFQDFHYEINGANILWSNKNLSGQFLMTDTISSRIIDGNPKDIFQLITLFN